MKLKIVSTNWTLVDLDNVNEVIVPVKDWEIWILPGHAMYSWVVKWWLCKFKTEQETENFLKDNEYNVVSIWDWVVYTDGKEVRIAVSEANATLDIDEEELQKMKERLEKEIEEIKAKWSIEEIEKALLAMNKIIADLELAKIKKKG